MLTGFNQQVNVNGTSVIDGKPVLYMSASIPSNGKFNINQSIQDETLYFDNLETVKADYDEFYAKVIEIAKSMSN